MADSFLSFANSASFRDILLARNLSPYTVTGVYSPPVTDINQEVILTVSSVINSPDDLIARDPFAQQLYPLNTYGPSGGYNIDITYNNPPLPVASNQGEYDLNDTKLDLVNEFFIDAAYIENVYGPAGGFQNMVTITSLQLNNKIYAPYWDPPTFVPSFYTPYDILLSNDPVGSSGPLSQDSFIAKLGAQTLKNLLQERINSEIYQNTIGLVNLDALQDPFEASLIATGQQPFIYKNWRITVAENPLIAAADFATRLVGAYWPVSPIPGDYFNENVPNGQSQQVSNALNVVNQLTGGFLGPVLNKTRNPSEIFLANTGNGQRSALFHNIDYNRYQPAYPKNFGGLLGVAQGLVNLSTSLINPNGTLVGGYYVGSRNAEPSTITSPPNQVPVNAFGQQEQSPVYGPSELGILFEGNSGQLNFGLQAKSLTDGGALDGEFVWVSPKYKGNAGFRATPGGGTGSLDNEFNQISSNYQRDESTNLTFKETSILDETQRLVNSADNVQGINRLKHVGNAINQVSKVFNDGYKELTKGSQVVSYIDNTTGGEKGIEYCRLFTKDTPYYTYADLQKRDGITTSGRRFTNSVLDNTYNLNIAPLKNPGSTNIQENAQGKLVAKKYMFSIENLAWRTSSRPGYTYDELPVCEKGPNGGRVMWFPPYDLKFSDSSTANWNNTSFLGRPEPIYTYKDTNRTGTLSWKIIVDNPSVMNVLVEKQLKGQNKERVNSIIDSFFAGCVKFDIYELAKKFNTIPTRDLYTYQEILNDPRLTPEQLKGIQREIPASNQNLSLDNIQNSSKTSTNDDPKAAALADKYKELAFYFHNDEPDPNTRNTKSSAPYDTWYNKYIALKDNYISQANALFASNTSYCTKNPTECSNNKNVGEFFDSVVIDNYNQITNNDENFIKDSLYILDNGGTITLDMIGSASAPANKDYNVNLSARRNDSVVQFFQNKLGKYMTGDKPTFKINYISQGETISIPKSSGGSGFDVNCTTDIQGGSGNITDNKLASIFSVSAMACRRVKIDKIVAKLEQKNEQTPVDKPLENKAEVINTAKPQPTIDIQKKIKEGISKKILRQLLSECDYFQVIKEENPMIYDSIKEKIKFFNPAFHSMTPEGLNARITFLNQCVRPGETIPIIGTDGKPKSNDAINTSFGAPPILILRIGDFYHTKIVPKNISFSYDPLIYDINPEGIGVQPMIVNVQMNFDFIGGHGLAKPVEQLQNALSFNFYGNTEIYDERAVWTEDTSALDKKLVDAILDGETPATVNNVDNQQQNNAGTTIGTIVTNIPVASGQTGEITYQKVMDGLLTQTKTYFTNTVNQLEKINNNTENGSYGLVQLLNSKKVEKTTEWDISGSADKLVIYGKPNFQSTVDSLFNNVNSDIDTTPSENIIIKRLIDKNFSNSDLLSDIKNNIKNYINNFKGEFSNNLATVVQELSTNQIDFVQTTRQINLVNGLETDGILLSNNVPRVYNLSGTTLSGGNSDGSYTTTNEQLNGDYIKLPSVNNEYNILLETKKIVYADGYSDGTFVQMDGSPSESLKTSEDKRFYIIMSRVLTNKTKRETFLNSIITGTIIQQDKTKSVKRKTEKILEDIGKDYSKNITFYEKKFADLKKDAKYLELTDGIENKLYKSGKPRKFTYSTVDGPNKTNQEAAIKDLYLNIPKFN